MNINFEYHNVSASDNLEIFASKKLDKLFNRYDFIVSADVYFKKQNTADATKGKICQVRLGTPGQTVYTEANNADFEASINEIAKELDILLKKRKDKFNRR